jgi:DNA-binding NarL/FixJ family response regulator
LWIAILPYGWPFADCSCLIPISKSAERRNTDEAIEKAPSLRPDLFVLDLAMPVTNGLEAASLPKVWLILLTTHDFLELSQVVRSAGIHAVVPKSKAVTHLIAQAGGLFGMTS